MKKAFALWLAAALVVVTPALLAPTASAIDTSNYTQIFGLRPSWYQYKGIKDYDSAQDPYIANHVIQPWAGNPNGMIDTATNALFESGNDKAWNPSTNSWKLAPYYSFLLADGTGFSITRFDLGPLTPATYYTYETIPTGVPHRYQTIVCSDTYCVVMADVLFSATNAFNDVRSGGEAPCPQCAIGYINLTQHQFLDTSNSTWYSYCYTSPWSHNANGTNPSQCRPGIDPPNWYVLYH